MAPEPSSRSSALAFWVATAGGIGYAPVASGTFGSLPGLALAWLLLTTGGTLALLIGLAGVAGLGWWSAGRVGKTLGVEDPGVVVIDEVAGQLLSLAFFPPTAAVLLAAFLLFRFFDIVKPPPARQFESLPGSSGIMADDLMAGVYANLALHAIAWGFPGFLGYR